jgi:hypothetical protein
VRAVGGLMGNARDAFGTGVIGARTELRGPGRRPAPPASANGLADQAARDAGAAVDRQAQRVQALDDEIGPAITGAADAEHTGRRRVDAAIDQAVADIAVLSPASSTPCGQQVLVEALTERLHATKRALEDGDRDAATRAASAHAGTADYNATARFGGPSATPLPIPAIPQLPQLVPATMLPLAGLAQVPGMLAGRPGSAPMSEARDELADSRERSSAAAIPLGEVRYERGGFERGRDAFRGYVAKTLDTIGITDQHARNNWMRGLLVAASRESSFNPDAVNLSDSNARGMRMPDGAPAQASRGGLQTIPTTFAGNHQPGTSTNIYDPVANIASAMNYVMRRYGVSRDGADLAARVPQFNPDHAPQGY